MAQLFPLAHFVAPPVHAGAAPDAKSGKAHETTGQAPKTDEKAGQAMEKSPA